MNRKLENALRARIQRRFGTDIFVCTTLSWETSLVIYVDRTGYQSRHVIGWYDDWASFDRDVFAAITKGDV